MLIQGNLIINVVIVAVVYIVVVVVIVVVVDVSAGYFLFFIDFVGTQRER